MASRKRTTLKRPAKRAAQKPLLYTAQDIARFCEVDLKTVHHWAGRGKVPHHRTEGRHLRFRRNDVVRFLRAHGYPLPATLARARPAIALAIPRNATWASAADEHERRLSAKFEVRRFDSAVQAIARMAADESDALVVGFDDPTFGGPAALMALKSDPATSWVLVAVVAAPEALAVARDAGADVALAEIELSKLSSELARALAVAG